MHAAPENNLGENRGGKKGLERSKIRGFTTVSQDGAMFRMSSPIFLSRREKKVYDFDSEMGLYMAFGRGGAKDFSVEVFQKWKMLQRGSRKNFD